MMHGGNMAVTSFLHLSETGSGAFDIETFNEALAKKNIRERIRSRITTMIWLVILLGVDMWIAYSLN